LWRLKACSRCLGGDLFKEEGGWTCLQCGAHVHQNGSRAERRAGELLAEMEKNPGTRYGSCIVQPPPTLEELGIEKTQSHRWQAEARVPEEWQVLQDAVDVLG
jgi:hypothetical protein